MAWVLSVLMTAIFLLSEIFFFPCLDSAGNRITKPSEILMALWEYGKTGKFGYYARGLAFSSLFLWGCSNAIGMAPKYMKKWAGKYPWLIRSWDADEVVALEEAVTRDNDCPIITKVIPLLGWFRATFFVGFLALGAVPGLIGGYLALFCPLESKTLMAPEQMWWGGVALVTFIAAAVNFGLKNWPLLSRAERVLYFVEVLCSINAAVWFGGFLRTILSLSDALAF
jgi:hypothetical protein